MTSSSLLNRIGSALSSAKVNQSPPPPTQGEDLNGGRVLVLGSKKSRSEISQILGCEIQAWQMRGAKPLYHFDSLKGPTWLLCLWLTNLKECPQDINELGGYSLTRDYLGHIYAQAVVKSCDLLEVSFVETSTDSTIIMGGLVGIEMGQYRYKDSLQSQNQNKMSLYINKWGRASINTKLIDKALALGSAVNISRHLVNLPPSDLNPQTYASILTSFFQKSETLKVTLWKKSRLEKEGMGLLLGVGKGAEYPPCMVHLKYRPKGVKGRPIAFVGKGITFDTGGLNLKPDRGMRLMKKDMGGAASVVALAHWACRSQIRKNLDFYLAIAENSVSMGAMRPSDVLTARNGVRVEVHNTDAEGRLVLADVLDVAKTQKDKPRYVVDLATLTGAIKAALGCEVGGLFGNNQKLVEEIYQSSLQSGDLLWHMPLVQSYRSQLDSTFADIQNCSDSWGGAVTAALFLESFVKDIPWAHLDIYAWNDRAKGALCEIGGSGQAVQCLAHWLSR